MILSQKFVFCICAPILCLFLFSAKQPQLLFYIFSFIDSLSPHVCALALLVKWSCGDHDHNVHRRLKKNGKERKVAFVRTKI